MTYDLLLVDSVGYKEDRDFLAVDLGSELEIGGPANYVGTMFFDNYPCGTTHGEIRRFIKDNGAEQTSSGAKVYVVDESGQGYMEHFTL